MSFEKKQAISETILSYATAIDSRDWSLFRQCFSEDVVADYGDFGRWTSVDEFAQFMADVHRDLGATLHRITNIVIAIEGKTAKAKTYVDALLMPGAGGGEPHSGIGYYEDQLSCINGEWKITQRIFTLVHSG